MPTLNVQLDSDLHTWLCQRARDHGTSPATELAALAAAARTRESTTGSATELPLGVYEADDGTTVVELGSAEADDDTDLPVGVYDDDER